MSKDTFDAVLASVPQGAVAGRVTSRGTHWVPANKIQDRQFHWTAPPLMRRFKPGPFQKSDLTGTCVGRLTVIGALHDSIPGRARWVVRCACGDYETRRSSTLKKFAAVGATANQKEGWIADRCHNCSELQSINHKYRTLGAKPAEEFFVSRLKP